MQPIARKQEKTRQHYKLTSELCSLSLQGSAAFWWNLKKNGYADLRTRHAGCPVLAGSKWGMYNTIP